MADLPSPSQSGIDALNTITPNLADLPHRTSTYERHFTHEGNYLVYLLPLTHRQWNTRGYLGIIDTLTNGKERCRQRTQ